MANDPYKYFRVEARELADQLSTGILDLERGAAAPEIVPRLLRMAHTLKGAARVVKQIEIAEAAHAMEDVLVPFRENPAPIPKHGVDELLSLLDKIATQTATLGLPAQTETGGAETVPDEFLRIVRADPGDMEALLDGISEACAHAGSLRRKLTILEKGRHLARLLGEQLTSVRDGKHTSNGTSNARARLIAEELSSIFGALERDLTTECDGIDSELQQVRETADHLRLVPASVVFTSMARVVRDTAQSVNRQAVFKGIGGDIRVDANVIGSLQGALLQLVRNAVAHGIESAPQRTAAAKSPNGTVTLRVMQRGRRVAFACSDDGRGIDLAGIVRVAESRGLIPAGTETPDREGVLRLILKSGVTTAVNVSDVSGRGIGLDVVREAADRLGGEVDIQTEAGKGTTIEIMVPLTLASLDALIVEVSPGGPTVAIPMESVRQISHISAREVTRAGAREAVLFENGIVPFSPLHRVLALKNAEPAPRSWSVLIIRGKQHSAALGVHRVVGISRVVIRPLPEHIEQPGVVAGASLDAEGNPQLVLDPDGLVRKAQDPIAFEAKPSSRPDPILVIDDSLTTRMLEQTILESAGYAVDVATSGEEALEKARLKRYALFLVDVEMPGMDGFSFIQETRGDADLRDIPAVLVTSRSSPEDRKKGLDVGAKAYVVKSEFDQDALLQRIRELVM